MRLPASPAPSRRSEVIPRPFPPLFPPGTCHVREFRDDVRDCELKQRHKGRRAQLTHRDGMGLRARPQYVLPPSPSQHLNARLLASTLRVSSTPAPSSPRQTPPHLFFKTQGVGAHALCCLQVAGVHHGESRLGAISCVPHFEAALRLLLLGSDMT